MSAMASAITSRTIIYSAVYSSADQRKHQSSASLAFVRGIYRWPVNSPHKWPVTRKIVPFDDVIMVYLVIVTPKLIYSQEIMYKTCFYSSMATAKVPRWDISLLAGRSSQGKNASWRKYTFRCVYCCTVRCCVSRAIWQPTCCWPAMNNPPHTLPASRSSGPRASAHTQMCSIDVS